jgi:hypothetical protein
MRRGLSILLVLFFSLGPLTAMLQADEDSRLPACCRRDGKHHCAMSEETAARLALAAAGPVFTAPARCPFFPRAISQSTNPTCGLANTATNLPDFLTRPLPLLATRAAAVLAPIRTRPSRGPPASTLD